MVLILILYYHDFAVWVMSLFCKSDSYMTVCYTSILIQYMKYTRCFWNSLQAM